MCTVDSPLTGYLGSALPAPFILQATDRFLNEPAIILARKFALLVGLSGQQHSASLLFHKAPYFFITYLTKH